MKNIPLSVLVVTVAVGAVIGAVTSSLLAPSHDPKSDAPPPVVVEASGLSELEAGLRSLQKASAELLRRIAALEQRPVPTSNFSETSSVTKEDLAKLTERVEGWMASKTRVAALKDQVANTLQAVRKEETAARAQRKAAARRAGREKRLERISQELNLSTQQAEDLRLEFEARALRNEEVKRVWEETPELIGPVKTAAHEAHQTALGRIFTPQQLETYQASQLGAGKR